MNRRGFFACLAAAPAVRGSGTRFKAIAAQRMPASLIIPGACPAEFLNGIFELRRYHPAPGPAAELLHRADIHPLIAWPNQATLLIPFASLEAREQAWRRFDANASAGLHPARVEISLYRYDACSTDIASSPPDGP